VNIDYKKFTDNGIDKISLTSTECGELVVEASLLLETKKQVSIWVDYLNGVMGLTAFALVLAIQGTKSVILNSIIAFILIMVTHIYMLNKFPSVIANLRMVKAEKAKMFAIYVERNFMSYRLLSISAIPFFIGFSYLLFMFVGAVATLVVCKLNVTNDWLCFIAHCWRLLISDT